MTLTTLLSARVREIEQRAAPLPDLLEELEEIMARKDELEAGIERATQAARQLKMIDFQVQALLDGTGSTVEITGGQEVEPEPEDAPKVPDVEPVEPVVVDAAPAEPEPEPTPALTIMERILAYLAEHPNSTSAEMMDATGMRSYQLSPPLTRMHQRGQILHDDGKPYRYRLPDQTPAPLPVAPEPAQLAGRSEAKVRPPTQTIHALEPIPERLSLDERTLFDALRHELEGLTRGLLVSRLNWSGGRVDRTVTSLIHEGHIRMNGTRYVVISQQVAAD